MKETGGVVRAGPFAGLRYPVAEASGSSLGPKLLGCYELEIHPFVESAIANRPTRIVNIGAGEGYYAVGMALRVPEAEVHAFDTNDSARDLTKALAQNNGVAGRLHVHGECGVADLRRLTVEPALVICDVEGAERELLDPRSVPGLAHCEIIAELHRVLADDLIRELDTRFRTTHRQSIAHYDARDPRRGRGLDHFPPGDRRIAFDERRRHGLDWIHLVPTASTA